MIRMFGLSIEHERENNFFVNLLFTMLWYKTRALQKRALIPYSYKISHV